MTKQTILVWLSSREIDNFLLDFLTAQAYSLSMDCLSVSRRVQVVAALVEGNSVNSVSRMTGITKRAIIRLLAEMGCACAEYHNKAVCNLKVRRVQCDEIWTFVYAKQKNVTLEQMSKGAGDCWT